ncbi:unnamed protein product [Diabrotica balteata]|uniref:HTH psq-type domain-containing protein n=1 Tax=Diabrotica balteata TaxID=107213 RepID=A0A9N9X454_DIABA|nr:unnamed protein product [Diabrotica balteata]
MTQSNKALPTKYKREENCQRGLWTKNQLESAIHAVRNEKMEVNAGARNFEVPAPTLRRIMKSNNKRKSALGASSVLSEERKKKKAGFAPTTSEVREMAFRLAKELKIKTTFNKEKKLTDFD